MNKDFLKVVLFFFGGLLAFIYIGNIFHKVSGGAGAKNFV